MRIIKIVNIILLLFFATYLTGCNSKDTDNSSDESSYASAQISGSVSLDFLYDLAYYDEKLTVLGYGFEVVDKSKPIVRSATFDLDGNLLKMTEYTQPNIPMMTVSFYSGADI
ncbi:MAG: hypothetical protein FWG90_00870 [Oscillospiraceae bacterium]|nr:hypothetical protein [Oscillospiraceae bacterium]